MFAPAVINLQLGHGGRKRIDMLTNDKTIHIWRLFLWTGCAHLEKQIEPNGNPICNTLWHFKRVHGKCPIYGRFADLSEGMAASQGTRPVTDPSIKKPHAMNLPSGHNIEYVPSISGDSSVIMALGFPIPRGFLKWGTRPQNHHF